MSKKGRGLVLDSGTPYVVGGVYDGAKARQKQQTLMQDYQELQNEVDAMRSKLEAGKQRKMILAAEVRFLRRRYEYFVKTNAINSSQKEKLAQPRNLLKQTKHMKEFSRKEASQHRLPPIPGPKPKKKHYMGKEVALALNSASPVSQHRRKILHGGKEDIQHLSLIADLTHRGRIETRKKTLPWNMASVLDVNQKERMYSTNDTALRTTIVAFDLNQDNSPIAKEASLPSRAPIFDLNEISTGDEDFQSNDEAVKFEEVKKNSMRCLNDEVQNDLKLSICRNAGEGSSRVGKRKISWQDPVALRV